VHDAVSRGSPRGSRGPTRPSTQRPQKSAIHRDRGGKLLHNSQL
jgi:hypothetical protein